ncbi:MAG TPA: AraC family transcriptional regulator [Polyangiaceae bacterium]|nr:AraC family transcriptional regulator [Polyangiaceae bacterium]
MIDASSSVHTNPAGLVQQLVELVARWGIAPEELLDGTGIDEGDLLEPLTRIPLPSYLAVVERARALTGEPGIGFCWGLQMRVSAFGYLGFATLSAGTLREALELVIQFGPLVSTATSLRLDVDGSVAVLTLDEHADFGGVRDVVVLARLAGLWKTAQVVTGRPFDAKAEIAFPEPQYHARFAHLFPSMRYGARVTRAFLDAGSLDLPLVMADPAALQLARRQCERQLETVSASGRLVTTVRRLLWDRAGGMREPHEIAEAVHLSPRTLRRRLAVHGSSLSALVNEERRERAMTLLRSPELTIDRIAEMLAYRSVQNFTRAFRQWTGGTPAAYRRQMTGRLLAG